MFSMPSMSFTATREQLHWAEDATPLLLNDL
jgi:hypothetical protein